MIELKDDALIFRFPHLGEYAAARVRFERTLRVPDTDTTYPLPAALGRFPLRHVDDFSARLPEQILRRGGVLMPMWQAEAMWISFGCGSLSGRVMPYAVKVGAGKINAVSGEPWREGLHNDPQDYCAIPRQPWLDGFRTGRDSVRQFVAMPLGAGVTAEEQLTGAAEHGGIQIAVTPPTEQDFAPWHERPAREPLGVRKSFHSSSRSWMGLAPGGSIHQVVHRNDTPLGYYDTARTLRVFVTILDAVAWRHVTGEAPPHRPPTARDYADAKIPWFDFYESDVAAIGGAPALKRLRSLGSSGALGSSDDDLSPSPTILLRYPQRDAERRARGRLGYVRPWLAGTEEA
jgi:hypothetical protein